MDIDEFEATQNGGQPDADISSVKLEPEEFAGDPTEKPAPVEPVVPLATPEPEVPAPTPPVVPEVKPVTPEVVPEPEKPVQTPEENAKFAEQRRTQQAELRAKEALDKLKDSDPAFKTAKLLEEMYGVPIDQIHDRINQSRLEEIAKAQNLPVETVVEMDRQKQDTAQTKQENIKLQFDAWTRRVESEGQDLKTQYPALTDADIESAQTYMLNTLKNPDLPLSQAVHAVHGTKIADAIKLAAKNEALAELSGRAPSPLPPQGGKPLETKVLSAEEDYVRQKMGISAEDWLKYK